MTAMAKTITRTPCLTVLFLAGSLVSLASPAAAATFVKFYNGGSGYSGDWNTSSPNTVYNDTKGGTLSCPTSSPSCGGSDVLGTTLTFNVPGNTITASVNAVTGNQVWDDLQPNWGGLGVGTGSSGADTNDQIDGTNVLTLSFATQVMLKGVATLFDSGHTPFGPGSTTTGSFLLSVNGGSFTSILFSNANNELLNLPGTTFAFEEASNQPEFYVSGLDFQPTPIPGALPLFAGGLGVMGLLLRRRKRKAALAV
jgi:hypothetical protein